MKNNHVPGLSKMRIAFLLFMPFFLSACGDDGIVVFDDGQQQVIFNPEVDKIPNPEAHAECIKNNSVVKNAEQAKFCYLDALAGDVDAESFIGEAYFQGRMVQKDMYKAFEWFSKAARQKDIHAAIMLGSMYTLGDGCKQDLFKGVFWYTMIEEFPIRDVRDIAEKKEAQSLKEHLLKNYKLSDQEQALSDFAIQKYKDVVFPKVD